MTNAAPSKLYGNMMRTANRILSAKGSVCSFTQTYPGTYDPATGTNTPATVGSPALAVAVFDPGDKTMAHKMFDTGQNMVEVGKRKAIISAIDQNTGQPVANPLKAGDTYTDGGGYLYTIEQVKTIGPDGGYLLFICVVRK